MWTVWKVRQVEQIEKQEHADEKLNNLMRNYHENQEKAKIMYERRKKEMLQMKKKSRNLLLHGWSKAIKRALIN